MLNPLTALDHLVQVEVLPLLLASVLKMVHWLKIVTSNMKTCVHLSDQTELQVHGTELVPVCVCLTNQHKQEPYYKLMLLCVF